MKILVFLLLFSIVKCQETNFTSMSAKLPIGYRPMKVKIQFRIMHVYNFDLSQQTLRISGYLRQSWNDPRLVSDKWDSQTPDGMKFYIMVLQENK